MSKKIWSMSTTVRSPYRAKEFLAVLKEIEGYEWNNSTQMLFQILLIKNRYYIPTNNNLSEKQIDLLNDATRVMSLEEARNIFSDKNYNDPAMRGRTSFDPLEKLGLAQITNNKITITPQGIMLLNDEINPSDMQFKSLLKLQYPNPLSKDFKSVDGYNIKPFVITLHLINEVNKLCKEKGIKEKGISKEEFGIFGLSLINYDDLIMHATKLIEYRLHKQTLKTNEEKRNYYETFVDGFLNEYSNATISNIKDYSDNCIRYFRQTKYLYIRGGGYYMDIEPRRYIEISSILQKDDGKAISFSREEYKNFIGNYNLYELPWETPENLKVLCKNIIEEVNSLKSELGLDITIYSMDDSVETLKENINKLRTERTNLQNLKIKKDYQDKNKIDEAIYSLQNITKLQEKPSIALEKWTNIALNILNDAIQIKPNCPVGDDNEPTYTAPANVADIECFYNNLESICEVTMLTGRNQWYNEGQPVQRHLRDFEEKRKNNLPKYCLFISPRIHRDTINTFWNAIKYEFEGTRQYIVPLNITQMIMLLDVVKELKSTGKRFTNIMLKNLYDNILDISTHRDSISWINSINGSLNKWRTECVS